MARPPIQRRLDDLLIDPRETLDIELKGWLDLTTNDHKAVLAKALLALANHGGGFVIIGLESGEDGCREAPGRPAALGHFNPDTVNAAVAAYADPVFHCDVVIATAPDGWQFPIISVPGGHSVPIRCRRDGPNGQTLRQNAYYVRRPGPQSEPPQSAQEWDALIRRCISNGREALLDQFRLMIAGGANAEPEPDAETRLQQWLEICLRRWNELVATLPAGSGSRMELGQFISAYRLDGAFERPDFATLRDMLDRATVRHTGWPPFWVPTRQEIRPYIHDGFLECWIGRDADHREPSHADFWRVSPNGELFLIRGLQEDSPDGRRIAPGEGFDITLPTWRVGEILLHAESMARQLGDAQAHVTIQFSWTGLRGRRVVSLSGHRYGMEDHVAHQDTFTTSLTVQADQISESLPELVDRIVRPLYTLFDFLQLPLNLTQQELAEMRANRR